MKNIKINYVVLNDISESKYEKLTEVCNSSKNHNVSINFYDFSLVKKIKNYKEKNNVSIIEESYEDYEKAQEIIINNFTSYANSSFVAILNDSTIIENIDIIDFESLYDVDMLGFVYTDYTIDGVRCFMKSHSANNKSAMPIVFWKKNKLIEHINGEENPLASIYGSSVGIHIPESICTIHTNDE